MVRWTETEEEETDAHPEKERDRETDAYRHGYIQGRDFIYYRIKKKVVR